MLAFSDKGDNSTVDMLVGDICRLVADSIRRPTECADGSDYSKIGLKSSTIASSFGKVFRKGRAKKQYRPEDISRSLLYAISNNIGQIACVPSTPDSLCQRCTAT
jgi:type II pantothenate kinase